MNKQSKILLIIGSVVLVFALVIIFWPEKKIVIDKKMIKTIPASVVIIPSSS
jgi:hypothetical protein